MKMDFGKDAAQSMTSEIGIFDLMNKWKITKFD